MATAHAQTMPPTNASNLAAAASLREGIERTGTGPIDDVAPDALTIFGTDPTNNAAKSTIRAEISAANSDGKVSLKLAHSTLPSATQFTTNGWNSKINTWSVTLSAPVNKTNSNSDIIGIGGVPFDFSAKFGFSRLRSYGEYNTEAIIQGFETARQSCLEVAMRVPDMERMREITACQNSTGGDLVDKLAELTQKEVKSRTGDDMQAAAAAQAIRVEFDIARNSDVHSRTWGFEGFVGYNKFDFLDASSIASKNTTKVPWSAKAFLGFAPTASAFLILGSIEYRKSYTSATAGTLCPVPSGGTVVTCSTGAIGDPKEKESLLTSLELRRQYVLPDNFLGLGSIAIRPRVIYDTKTDVYGFDFPLLFAADEKKNLIGGVRLGWQSDAHDFIAGLFVGAPFSIFP